MLHQEKHLVSTLPMAAELFLQFSEPMCLKELHKLVVGAEAMTQKNVWSTCKYLKINSPNG